MKKEKELLVAVASQKGGVGKSVFTVLLASVLHYRKGLRVAVVDCDYPQHSIALMRERDMESVMKNDDLKVSLYRQHERIRKPAYPVIKSDPEKAVEDLHRYMDEKGETFDIVLFDLPGTLRSEGVVYTVAAMDYIFVPLKADNIVMQSSLQFTKALEEELVARKNCNLKGTWLFWNMVDRRGRKDLYDAWNRVIDKMGLRLLSISGCVVFSFTAVLHDNMTSSDRTPKIIFTMIDLFIYLTFGERIGTMPHQIDFGILLIKLLHLPS